MIDIAYTIYAFTYDAYRLKGFLRWDLIYAGVGALMNLICLARDIHKGLVAIISINLILEAGILVLLGILSWITKWGTIPSQSLAQKVFKLLLTKIVMLICIVGFVLSLIYLICYCSLKGFERNFMDICSFFVWDTWVAVFCFTQIIDKLFSNDMQSIKEYIKEKERQAKDEKKNQEKKNEQLNENKEVVVYNNDFVFSWIKTDPKKEAKVDIKEENNSQINTNTNLNLKDNNPDSDARNL
jgi:hypothetical protein